MFRSALAIMQISACAFFWSVGGSIAFAEKPPGVSEGRGAAHAQKGRTKSEARFDANDRAVVREYFAEDFRKGSCPPGLAKKRNGCMPPGQARNWKVGRPLPRDVVIYDLPPELVVKIGLPPPNYKYVRAASDILLIAVGTSMVVDAINDLGRM